MKRCESCGVEKPLSKFHSAAHSRCKVCHNGVTDWNVRRSAMMQERQPKEPDESQIAAACLLIQQRWSAKKKASRKKGRVGA